jgi:hypothetical protein
MKSCRRTFITLIYLRDHSALEEYINLMLRNQAAANRCETYFANEGCIIDQSFQDRLPDGMIRCCMGMSQADEVLNWRQQHHKGFLRYGEWPVQS